jgi:Ca2+/Na+ antiporter
LAIGNVVGSAISNILGAFSLGLLFHSKDEPVHFDQSSRVYSLVLLALTTFTLLILCLPGRSIWLVHGTLLIASFAIYIASVGWAISRGSLTAPEGSDSSSSSDSENISDNESIDGDEVNDVTVERENNAEGDGYGTIESPHNDFNDQTAPIINPVNSTTQSLSRRRRWRRRALHYHVLYLFFGLLAICLAGYLLAHAASSIVDEFNMSDLLFGVVILAIATTLPEKFIAVLSGHRGYTGVLVANTAGSNIFLLTLCLGIVILDTKGGFERGSVGVLELGVLWGSTVAFTATVWCGARFSRWIGGVMIAAYIAFVLLEFAAVT